MRATANDFRSALFARFRAAALAGQSYVDIAAGDLHREVGGYRETSQRVPNCCSLVRQEFRALHGDDLLSDRMANGAAFEFGIRFHWIVVDPRSSRRLCRLT